MSTHKTIVDQETITSFLNGIFPEGISNFETIKGGEGSQAFSFSVLDDQYIIRINKNGSVGFEKDQYAFRHFASPILPIPEVCNIGKIDENLYFCISKKSEGKILDAYTDEEKRGFAIELFATLNAIHAIDISGTEGYGEWNSSGQAMGKSWKQTVMGVDYRVLAEDGKPGLFETSFLEKDVHDAFSRKISELSQYCSEKRYLLHADCGFDNLLSDGRKITGVIDWENSMYGDELYDLAWLSFWWPEIGYEPMYIEYAKNKEIEIEHFNERVLCYKLCVGLNALIFFASTDQKDKYEYTKGVLGKLL